jgi:endonuclease YncB( thermonuclease family)
MDRNMAPRVEHRGVHPYPIQAPDPIRICRKYDDRKSFRRRDLFAPSASAQGPGSYRVVDGDMIHAPFGVKYRLMGFDTPEIHFAKCTEEFALGMAAKERLEELLASGEVRIIESGRTDKFRRTLAHVEVDGRDVGEILIGEGLARPYKGGKRKPWC